MEQNTPPTNESLEVIDTVSSSLENPEPAAPTSSSPPNPQKPSREPKKRPGLKQYIQPRLQSLLSRFNIYLLIFIFVVLFAIVTTIVAIQLNRKDPALTFDTQTLDEEALKQLNNSSTTIGDPKQLLTIESNAVFSGNVLVRSSLDVAGTIRVGGELNLPGITVAGTSNFDEVQMNSLNVTANGTIQGQLNIQQDLTVSGDASFGGVVSAPQITIDTLTINKDLQLNRHIDAGGLTPGRSDGTALGSGGTTSISGTDTAGTVTINTGGSPGAGCFVTVSFAQAFSSTPHVVVTPIGSAAASLNYYVNRTSTSFSICTTNSAPSTTSFSFDYIVID